jgi:hypothetical protein
VRVLQPIWRKRDGQQVPRTEISYAGVVPRWAGMALRSRPVTLLLDGSFELSRSAKGDQDSTCLEPGVA